MPVEKNVTYASAMVDFVCKIINTEVRKSTFGKKVVREALLAAYECMITVL